MDRDIEQESDILFAGAPSLFKLCLLSGGRGRGLLASEDIEPGQIIFTQKPVISGNINLKLGFKIRVLYFI